MNFYPVITGTVFIRDVQDVNLVAASADPVDVSVSAGNSAWTVPVTPVLAGQDYVACLRMREILAAVVTAPGLADAGVREVPLVSFAADGATMAFRALYGGAAGRTPAQLAGNWLTWREQVSRTYAWGRERLTFLAGLDLLGWTDGTYTVSVTIYRSGEDPVTQTLASGTLQAGCRYVTVDVSYAVVSALVSGTILAWDVSFAFAGTSEGDAATLDGYPIRLVLARQDVRAKEFVFANSFGVEDRVYSAGRSNPKVDGVAVPFLAGGEERELRNDAEDATEIYSGHIASAREGALWLDFLKSYDRYIIADGVPQRIVVDSRETDLQDYGLGSVKFTCRLAKRAPGRFFSNDADLGSYPPEPYTSRDFTDAYSDDFRN